MSEVRPDEISAILRRQLTGFEKETDIYEVGTVLQVGDGVARIYGLTNVMASELVEFPNGVMGMVLNLEEDNVGVVLFGEDSLIKEGLLVVLLTRWEDHSMVRGRSRNPHSIRSSERLSV
jgi:F-type H+-transporting ATPase subunit alpha